MKSILPLVVAMALAAVPCLAGEPTHDLGREAAQKLIKLLTDDYQERIEIVLISSGAKVVDGLEDKNVRRVMAIHPVPEEGKRVRRVRCYDFHWDDDYGWHCIEQRQERGVDVVYIFSELRGEVVVK